MGNCAGAREIPAHERCDDVHVRQHSTNLQHYDGVHVVQEPHLGSAGYE